TVRRPGDGPFDAAPLVRKLGLAEERRGGHRLASLERAVQEIEQAAGEVEGLLGRGGIALRDERRVAAPADLDPAEEIGLGPRHAIEPRRLEAQLLAEDLR